LADLRGVAVSVAGLLIMAAGCASDPGVEVVAPASSFDRCGGRRDVTLAFVRSIPASELVDCFGSSTIAFDGYASQMVGIPTCPEVIVGGGWLRPCGGASAILVEAPGDEDGLAAYHPPTLAPGALPTETWVRVEGHFDDPAAQMCAVEGAAPTAETVAACRALFVIERMTRAAP
jgi:hypothetical protein